MFLKDFFNIQVNELSTIYSRSEARKILELFYEAVLSIPRFEPTQYESYTLNAEQRSELDAGFEKLLQSMPVQYVTGKAWFYGYPFTVSPAVLIPRPETEELVEQVLLATPKNHPSKIMDIGTGSGCIPIVLKKKLPIAEISAIDISEEALAIARENAKNFSVEIAFIQQDFLNESLWGNFGIFDIIVSNPPYIGKQESVQMAKTVKDFEPALALFVPDERVLIFYEKLAAFGNDHLSESGIIFAEINQAYPGEIKKIFVEAGYDAQILDDMSGNPRMLRATRSR